MTMTKPIAIVGGGPCGLSLARLLHLANIPFTVFERDVSSTPESRFQGGTLDIHPRTGQELLRRAGLHGEFNRFARYDATTVTLQDWRGGYRQTFGQDRDAPEIDRVQLRQILLDSLPESSIQWNKGLESVTVDNGQPRLKFTDETEATGFKLLIGADGAWSKIRSLITSEQPVYSGKMFLEGYISHSNPKYNDALRSAQSGAAIAVSANSVLAVQQMSDRSYRVYLGIKAPRSSVQPGGELDPAKTEESREVLLNKYYKDFAPELRDYIQAAEGPFRPWTLNRLNPDSFAPESAAWKHVPGVVLIGDAAHLTTPNGEGASEAMYDALRLFDKIRPVLEESDDMLDKAILEYEAESKPRSRQYIQRGIDLEDAMYSETAVQNLRQMGENDVSKKRTEASTQ